jgi:hypothetical protein
VRLALGVGLAPAQQQPDLKPEELFEDEPSLRCRSEVIQLVEIRLDGREMREP